METLDVLEQQNEAALGAINDYLLPRRAAFGRSEHPENVGGKAATLLPFRVLPDATNQVGWIEIPFALGRGEGFTPFPTVDIHELGGLGGIAASQERECSPFVNRAK
jgi:hypothetical protein